MDILSINALLSYLYNFIFTFFICVVGSIIADFFRSAKNRKKINLKSILIRNIFIAAGVLALTEWIRMSFNMYVFMCVFIGMWSNVIIESALNTKRLFIIIKVLALNLSGSWKNLASATKDAIEEIDKEENKDKKKTKDSE